MKNPFDWIIKESLEKSEDQYKKSRIILTFRIWMVLTSFFIVLGGVLIVFNDDLGTIYLIAAGLLILIPVGYYLRKNRVDIAGYIIGITGVVLVSVGIFTFENPMPLDGGLWLLIFCIYSYFTLGRKAGNVLFFVSLVSYSFYLIFRLPDNLALYHKTEIGADKVVILVSMITIIFLIIRHIIVEFVKTKDAAEKMLKDANSELIYQNSIIESQNTEKTLMMKEIHHRVKNNLQVINSLLRIQSSKLKDESTREVFNDAQNRVIAMALIHEEMYKNKSLDKVNVQNYIRNLTKEIVKNNSTSDDINVITSSDLEFIHNKQMVSLGLIINELVMNSIKHGFTEESIDKRIEIAFVCEKPGDDCENCSVVYKDNGKGLNIKQVNTKDTFGMEMIEALSEQLDGTFEILDVKEGVEMVLKLNCSLKEG